MTLQGDYFLPRGDVEQSHRRIAARGERLAIGREGQRRALTGEVTEHLQGSAIPEDDQVRSSGGQRPTVGREGERADANLVDRLVGPKGSARPDGPESRTARIVRARDGEKCPIR